MTIRGICAAGLFGCIAAGIGGVAESGVNEWTRVGPDLGQIEKIVWSPTDNASAWAISNNLLYHSSDGGVTWSALSSPSHNVCDIAADPHDASRVFLAACSADFAIVNADGTAMQTTANHSVIVNAASGNTLYGAGYPLTVQVSTDGGNTWQDRSSGLPSSGYPGQIAVSPVSANVAWLSVSYAVYYTDNGGASWSAASGVAGDMYSIAGSPVNSAIVFGAQGSVVRSVDGGATWKPYGSGYAGNIVAVAFGSADGTKLYAANSTGSIYVSTNSGWTWSLISSNLNQVKNRSLWASTTGSFLVASGYAGASVSADGGSTWRPVSGIQSVYVDGFTQASGSAGRLFLSNGDAGVYVSDDSGATWATSNGGISKPGTGSGYVAGQIVHSKSDNNVVLAAYGLYRRSADGAGDWMNLAGASSTYYTKIAVANGSKDHMIAGYGNGTVVSFDGVNWDIVDELIGVQVNVIEFDPQNDNVAYIGTMENGIWKTTDGGVNWNQLLDADAGWVRAIAVDPHSSDTIYYGTVQTGVLGLQKSTDGGITWKQTSEYVGSGWIYAILINPSNSNEIIVGAASTDPAFRSIDGGKTWKAMSGGFDNNFPTITALAYDVNDSSRIYAATRAHGLVAFDMKPDLDITLDADSTSVAPGNVVGVSATLKNYSPTVVTDVVVTFSLTSGLRTSNLDSRCASASETVTCNIDILDVRDTIVFSVQSDREGTYSISAKIKSGLEDSVGSNNSDKLSVSYKTGSGDSSGGGGGGSTGILALALLAVASVLKRKRNDVEIG